MMAGTDSGGPFSGDENGASDSSVHLNDVLISDKITMVTTEYLKVCFKPLYRMRRLKNRGALLVLVLIFLVYILLFK